MGTARCTEFDEAPSGIAGSVCVLCRLPAESRTIPLETIAQRTKLSVDGVEFLLMKTLSLHLIEGIIDQVDSTVQVQSLLHLESPAAN